MPRSFPELTYFLADLLRLDSATVGNVIRRCREADLIARGKPGRGSPQVTEDDAARALIALMFTDRPVDAPAYLRWAEIMMAEVCEEELGPVLAAHPTVREIRQRRNDRIRAVRQAFTFPNDREVSLAEAIAMIIRHRLEDSAFQLSFSLEVVRQPLPFANLLVVVGTEPLKQHGRLQIQFKEQDGSGRLHLPCDPYSPLRVMASLTQDEIYAIADWLLHQPITRSDQS